MHGSPWRQVRHSRRATGKTRELLGFVEQRSTRLPSESLSDQELLIKLGYGGNRYAREHYEIIARFGRFPHRNEALGRQSTAEEASYLARRQ